MPSGQWQPSSQPVEKQPTWRVMWAQEKGHPSPGPHSRYRRPAGQPASGAKPASGPRSGLHCPPWLLLCPPQCLAPSTHLPVTPQLGRQHPPWVVPLRASVTPSHALPSLHLATSSSTCPSLAPGKGSVGGWDERGLGTCESASKANRGIGQGQTPGRGSPLQTWVRQVRLWRAGPGQGGRAHLRERSCSPPPHDTLQSSQGPQEPHTPGPGQPGTSWHCRMPSLQVLGTKRGASEDRTLASSRRAHAAQLCSPLPPCCAWLTSCHRAPSPSPRVPGSPRS